MPQYRSRRRKRGAMVNASAASLRATRAAAATSIAILVVSLAAAPLRAQSSYGGDNSSLASLLQKLGMSKSADSNIDYGERPPLVVPPTRDLPAPSAGPPTAADWPVDDKRKHTKAKPKPPSENAPPVMANPNPTVRPKTWYNPATWFNKEEYGAFTGEPTRADLTDPPSGYRTPSPDQPYGIGPEDKKARKKIGGDGTPVQTSTTPAAPPQTSTPQGSTAQGSAPPQTATAQASAPTSLSPPAGQPQTQAGR